MKTISPTFEELVSESKAFYDNTEALKIINYNTKELIIGSLGAGKSTFLSMLESFLNIEKDTRSLFSSLKISKRKNWDTLLNKMPVVLFSLDGISEKTFESAVQKIVDRVRSEMIKFLPGGEKYIDRTSDKVYRSDFCDILENKLDNAKDALSDFISFTGRVYGHKYECDFKTAFLVDEPFYPMLAACKYGYDEEMEEFLNAFLNPRRMADIIIGVSSIPIEQCDMFLYDSYRTMIFSGRQQDEFFMSRDELLKVASAVTGEDVDTLNEKYKEMLDAEPDRFHNEKEWYNDCSYSGSIERKKREETQVYSINLLNSITGRQLTKPDIDTHIILTDENIKFIKSQREQIASEAEQKRIQEEERRRAEKARYAEPLPDWVVLPTKFAGIRKLPELPKTEAYLRLNERLKEFYAAYLDDPDSENLYNMSQRFEKNIKTDLDVNSTIRLNQYKSDFKDKWCISVDNYSPFWLQVIAGKGNESYCNDHIKIYVSTGNTAISDIFFGAFEKLLNEAQHSFSTLAAKQMRDDSMCFWVRKSDLHILQDYFNNIDLVESLDFIAYKDKLGYSRELDSWDSHNRMHINLMKGYFSTVSSADDVDLSAMYQYLIDAWNGELPESDRYAGGFKKCSAQVLIIMLETIAIKTGYKSFDEDNILLSDDEKMWSTLCHRNCWADVAKRFREIYKDEEV